MKDKSALRDILLAAAILILAAGLYIGNRTRKPRPGHRRGSIRRRRSLPGDRRKQRRGVRHSGLPQRQQHPDHRKRPGLDIRRHMSGQGVYPPGQDQPLRRDDRLSPKHDDRQDRRPGRDRLVHRCINN